MIRFCCPDCQRVVEVSDDGGGQSMICPTCGRALLVPGSAPAAPCPMARPRVSAQDAADRGMTAIQDCLECGKSLQVPEEDVGRRVACPRCGRQLIARAGNGPPPRQADDNLPRHDDVPEVVAVDEDDRRSRADRKYCTECGARLARQARYCAECGAPRAERDPVLTDANSKKTTAGILAILVGSLGVHKFFLGLTTPAVVMLLVTVLTCGIGGIVMHVIGIVEGITYLTKSDEDFYQIYIVQQKEWF